MDDGNNICQLALESRVKVGAALNGGETVAVCELGKDTNVAVVFKLETCMVLLRVQGRVGRRTSSHGFFVF